MLIEKTKDEKELSEYLEYIVNNNTNHYSEDIKEIIIGLIKLILKDKIGDKKAKELTRKIKGGNENMLAVLEMLEENDRKNFRRGKKEGILEVARKMIIKKVPISEISDITGLTEKQISKIKIN